MQKDCKNVAPRDGQPAEEQFDEFAEMQMATDGCPNFGLEDEVYDQTT